MHNLNAEHLGSGREAKHWPKPDLPEFAFIGRSNVGKSSLVNMLVGIHRLARVSTTPGRTRNVEHFKVEALKGSRTHWLLADLPGYGFAKISKAERAAWQQMVRTYLRERENLQCVFLLVDVRLEPQQNDLEMIQWLGGEEIPFVILFTKSDKLKQPAMMSNVALYRRELKKTWHTLPHMIITSSETGKGRDEVLEFITEVNGRWPNG
ncbi:MAG: YihA family ribosome biogenesis GTP-binding protein [Flavobacteriales bacterium]|nr:YihA family ribosome biogenesis GTP-binding protein [Flavobacteriales bacterium]